MLAPIRTEIDRSRTRGKRGLRMRRITGLESFYRFRGLSFVLNRFRKQARTLARINLALFALVWLSAVAAPCAMAMQVEIAKSHTHECPRCPPQPCHEAEPADCQTADTEGWLSADKTPFGALLAFPTPARDLRSGGLALRPDTAVRALSRAGPRAHLLHAQFNE